MVEHGKILGKVTFDWEAGAEAAKRVQRDDGSINWRAALSADPGVVRCNKCERYLWNESDTLQCPCGNVICQ